MYTTRNILLPAVLILICLRATEPVAAQTVSFDKFPAGCIQCERASLAPLEGENHVILLPSATVAPTGVISPVPSSEMVTVRSSEMSFAFVGFYEGGIVEGAISQCGEITSDGDEGTNLKTFALAFAGVGSLALLNFRDPSTFTQIESAVINQATITPIPEPATLLLCAISLLITGAVVGRRRAIPPGAASHTEAVAEI